jgi:hypothetical protein
MAKQPTNIRRKLVGFDEETWHALNLLSREPMKTFQGLADEAFRDLLHKHGRAAVSIALFHRGRYTGFGSNACSGVRDGSMGCGLISIERAGVSAFVVGDTAFLG